MTSRFPPLMPPEQHYSTPGLLRALPIGEAGVLLAIFLLLLC